MNQTFTYIVGEENHPQIVDLKSSNYLEEAFFANQFKKSLRVIDSHLRRRSEKDKDGFWDRSNNIVAFIGERGTGKTSCMMSVVKILCEGDIPKDKYESLAARKCKHLDMIDPTYLDSDERSIVGAVVAQLYHNYIQAKEKIGYSQFCEGHFSQERELLEQFDSVQKNIRCLLEGKPLKDEDDLEQLSDLAATVNLRNNIKSLLDIYMKIVHPDGNILIIPIDDIDLQSAGATAMVEQIRKYLNHPDVLVLMALKLEQLQNLEQQKFLTEYKELIDRNGMGIDSTEVMADHYLVKLIPHNQRILMPDATAYLSQHLNVIYEDGTKEAFDTIQEAVPMLIFRKTRFLFYNINNEPSFIVPTNLRHLLQLLKMLVSMQDYYDWIGSKFNPKGDANNLYNKELFKNYFIESWVRSYLTTEARKSITELYRVPSALQFNSEVLRVLETHYPIFFEKYENSSDDEMRLLDVEMGAILRSNNFAYNLSIGDVMGILDMIERQARDTQSLRFLFAIRTLYSMRLYQYYDEKTDLDELKREQEKKNEEIRIEKRLRRSDILNKYELSNFDKLVGGNFINIHLNDLVNRSNNGGRLAWRVINLEQLNKLIEYCLQMDAKTAKKNKMLFELAEFFMLTVSREYNVYNTSDNYNIERAYRSIKEPYYAASFDVDSQYAVFDIVSFLFNITRIELCYARFGKNGREFFKKANLEAFKDISLLGKFKQECIKKNPERVKRENTYLNVWLSWASIRNAEILQDVVNYFDGEGFDGNTELDLLEEFFKKLGDYMISSYDFSGKSEVEDDKKYYKIHFSFASFIAKILASLDDESKDWFMKIFYLSYYNKTRR